jgi:hypothetical protein
MLMDQQPRGLLIQYLRTWQGTRHQFQDFVKQKEVRIIGLGVFIYEDIIRMGLFKVVVYHEITLCTVEYATLASADLSEV